MERKNKREIYLSKDNTDCLKGIFALCVLLHHLYQRSGLFGHSILGGILQYLGFWSVAMFFFLSGYGLFFSYKRKGQEYIHSFPRKRILPFYLIICFLILVYGAERLLLSQELPLTLLIKSLTLGDTVIGNGWYLQVQLLLYLLFYVFYKWIKRRQVQFIALSVGVAIYAVTMLLLGFSDNWFITVFAFLVGVLWAMHKEAIDDFIEKPRHRYATFAVVALLYCALTLVGTALPQDNIAGKLALIFSMILFVVTVILVLYDIPINCAVTRFLGKISLEIYVSQGLFLILFRSNMLYIANPWLYSLAVALSTFALACIFHIPFKKVYALCAKRKAK